MPFLKPHDTVYNTYSTKRWRKQYFAERKSVNLSGMIQEMQDEHIKKNSPDVYEKFVTKKVELKKVIVEEFHSFKPEPKKQIIKPNV